MFTEKLKLSAFCMSTLIIVCGLLITGCDSQEEVVNNRAILSELDAWVHTDNPAALVLLQDQVARFNTAHNRIRVSLISVPKGSYQAQLNAAIRTGTLPDIIELDGPFLYNLAERGTLLKLDKILTETTRQDILPAIFQQGMYQGRFYSLPITTNSVVLYARKSALQAADMRIPDVAKGAWGLSEFEGLLESLMTNSEYSAAIDFGINRKNEWLSSAFHPLLLSAGGGIVNEQPPYASSGVLNSRANVEALSRFQRWIKKGYVVVSGPDSDAFAGNRIPLSWGGLEKYEFYKSKFGDDLVVVPLPDLGHGSHYVQRAWGWGLTRNCVDTQSAMRFLEFLLQPEEVMLAAKANATLPATVSGLNQFDAFDSEPLLSELVTAQLKGNVTSQLKSPLYPVISGAFQQALVRIYGGDDVEGALNKAVQTAAIGRQKFEAEQKKAKQANRQ